MVRTRAWVRRYLLIGLFIVAVAAWCQLFIDIPLSKWISDHKIKWHKEISCINSFRQLGKAWVIIWLLTLWGWLTRRSRSFLMGLIVLAVISPSILPIKIATQRYRPETSIRYSSMNINRFCFKAGDLSFPSGDTATVFAIAAVLTSGAGWVKILRGAFFFTIAGAIGALRIVSLDHFLSDVIVGAAIGILGGRIALQYSHIVFKKDLTWMQTFWEKYAVLVLLIGLPLLIALCETTSPLNTFLQGYGPILLIITTMTRHHYRPWLRGAVEV